MKFIKTKGILMLLLLVLASLAVAQTPSTEILLTWKSNSYIPPDYQGKALAGPNSTISVALQTFYFGRPISVNDKKISWYINGGFMKAGVGLTTFSFNTKDVWANKYKIEAIIRDYESGNDISESILIPGANPLVIIDTPYPNKFIGKSFSLRAIPYFFAITTADQLSYNWDIAGEKIHTQKIAVDLEKIRSQINILVNIQAINRLSPEEWDNDFVSLKTKNI